MPDHQMRKYICPKCKEDHRSSMAGVKILLNRIGIIREYVNRGGSRLELENGVCIQLGDQCNSCDAAKILDAIKE